MCIRDSHIPSYLFLATIVAMFFGLTGAASEVLKDRALSLIHI